MSFINDQIASSTLPVTHRFLRACLRLSTDCTPIWLMRQAGRYLPEYRATRQRAGNFMALAQNTDWATEVTLQPLERFDLDAAILFSDILTIPDAMGLGLTFAQGEGPRFEHPIRHETDVVRVDAFDLSKLQYVFDAVASIRRALHDRVPLIGFSGSPWTLACYMVEGGGSDDYRLVKNMLFSRPDLMHRLLAGNAQAIVAYLNAQIRAGAQAVMLFDSWGGVLPHDKFKPFSLDYTQTILQQLDRYGPDGHVVPRIVFTKGGGLWLHTMSDLACDVIGLDWTCHLGQARQILGDRKALQGNLDPMTLFAPPEVIQQEAKAVLDQFGTRHQGEGVGSGHIFNLGHGISQWTPPEHVQALVEAVHGYSKSL